jgi:eukaryotic-like serine/threonine-protein kinase
MPCVGAPPECDDPDVTPAIPGLRVVRRLGRGGMGDVFLAVDASNRTVALKVIAAGLSSDPSTRERFDREIAAVSSIRHANIVRLLRAGEIDGAPYALLERVRGRSMERIGPQPWPVVVGLGRQLARATAAVHAAGWIHRDLKRANVMVGGHGLVTLIDFGLAKRWSDRDHRDLRPPGSWPGVTLRGAVVGTPRYLAPETRHGRPPSTATDVYSLGLTLHELLGGAVDADGAITAIPVRVPVDLAALVARALDPSPRRRPGAAEVAAVLETLPARRAVFRPRAHDDTPTWPVAADQRPTSGDGVPALRRAG